MDDDRTLPVPMPATLRGRWGRRRFLRLAAGGAALLPLSLVGCGDDQPPAESSEGATDPTATRAPGDPSHTATAPADETTATATPASSPTPDPTSEPTEDVSDESATPAAVAPTLSVDLWPQQVGIGESLLIRTTALGASSVVVTFRDVSYPMVAQGDGAFWLAVGVPLDAAAGARTLTTEARNAAGETQMTVESAYEVVVVNRPVDYLEVTDETVANTLTPEAAALESQLRGLQFATFDPLPQWSDFFLRPVDGAITTLFGQGRSINGGPIGAFHTGVDLANDAGTPVQLAAPGRVAWTGDMPIRGSSVIVDHGGGVKTGYHHLSAISVSVGDELVAGQMVGLVGMTGLATGPHLHWELTLWGTNVDPMTWTATSFSP